MAIFSRIIPRLGFKSHQMRLSAGDKVKVLVRKDLKSPVGNNIAGIFHLNNTKIYIPKEGSVMIGRSPECDIRIKDRGIISEQVMISHIDGNQFQIANLHPDKGLSVGNEKIKPGSHKLVDLSDKMTLQFELSGIGPKDSKRYLNMSLGIPAKTDKSAPIRTKPRLQVVLAKEPKAQHEFPINPRLLKGTLFEQAKTMDELMEIYYAAYRTFQQELPRSLPALFCIPFGVGLFAGTLLYGIGAFTLGTLALAIAALGPVGVLSFLIYETVKERPKEKLRAELIFKTNRQLIGMLKKLTTDEIAKLLAGRNKKHRTTLLRFLEAKDPFRVDTITRKLMQYNDALLIQERTAQKSPDAVREAPPQPGAEVFGAQPALLSDNSSTTEDTPIPTPPKVEA